MSLCFKISIYLNNIILFIAFNNIYYKLIDIYYDNYKNDYLKAFIDIAHKYNINVSAWQFIFYVGSHNLFSLINEEWLIKNLKKDNKVYNDYSYFYVLDCNKKISKIAKIKQISNNKTILTQMKKYTHI